MKRIITIIIILIFIGLSALEIGGVLLPDSYDIESNKLILNGAGLRKKVIIKVYACGLYLPEQNKDPEAILTADNDIAIRMHFIHKKVDQKKLINAWNEGFELAGADQIFKNEITTFNSFFNKPAQKDDIYMITYKKDVGTSVIINDETIGTIPGAEFRKAVFSIWLGDNTALPKLKDDLLGL